MPILKRKQERDYRLYVPIYIDNHATYLLVLNFLDSLSKEALCRTVLIWNFGEQYWNNSHLSDVMAISNHRNSVAGAWNLAIDHATMNSYNVICCGVDVRINHEQLLLLNDACNQDKYAIHGPKTVNGGEVPDDENCYVCWAASPLFFKSLETFELLIPTFHNHMKMDDWGNFYMQFGRVYEDYPGRFDENFSPAYWEDVDFARRVKRAGLSSRSVPMEITHETSRLLELMDQGESRRIKNRIDDNEERFKRKWGTTK